MISSASINLMPLFIVKRLSLGELTPNNYDPYRWQIELWLNHRESLKMYSSRWEKFIFPCGPFVVMDMEEDTQVPLLLGKPFLVTGAALIDV